MTAQETFTANWYSTTLSAPMGATDTSMTVASVSGAPARPCYLVVEPDNATQREVMLFTGLATNTFTGATVATNRYLTGSAAGSGLSHPAGSVVEFRPIAQLFDDINDRVDGLSGGVAATLFDANTILKADVDNTPTALTVAEQRLVGRITAGVITGLTAAQVRTLLDVPTNAEAILDTLVDAKGDLIVGTAADTVARLAVGTNGQVLTADSAEATGTKWAAAASSAMAVIPGFCLPVAYSTGITGSASNVQCGRISAVGASATGSAGGDTIPYVADRAGSIVGLSVVVVNARTAGTFSVEVYKNGAATGLVATIDGTNTQYGFAVQAAGLDTFVARDRLDVRYTTSTFTPAANNGFEAAVTVQYS